MSSWAKVGAKVVCVRIGRLSEDEINSGFLRLRTVYTIEGTFNDGDRTGLILEESLFTNHGKRIGYDLRRFRPVHTLRSDIRMVKSLVREMPASERLDRVLELLNEPEN